VKIDLNGMRVESKIKNVLIVLFVVMISGCECDPTYCPELSGLGKAYIEAIENFGDTVTYSAASGASFTFHEYEKRFNEPRYLNCEKYGFKCWCESQCSKHGNLYFKTDSLTNGYYGLSYRYSESVYASGPFSKISAGVIDFSRSYSTEGGILYYAGDSLLQTMTLNNQTYNNVYALTTDTVLYPDKIVSKTYFSLKEGLFAFWYRPGQELYVRE